METNICTQCKVTIEKPTDSFTTGYGIDKDGNKVCYACCGVLDSKRLADGKDPGLYLEKGFITNWCGTFRIPVTYSRHVARLFFGKPGIVGNFSYMGKNWAFRGVGEGMYIRAKTIK
jgi:hypothetical protein